MNAIRLEVPDDVLDALVAELVERALLVLLERFEASGSSSPYLTVKEAAAVLRAKPQRVYDLLSAGRLTRVKDGSRTLVMRSELDLVAHPLPRGPRSRSGSGVAR